MKNISGSESTFDCTLKSNFMLPSQETSRKTLITIPERCTLENKMPKWSQRSASMTTAGCGVTQNLGQARQTSAQEPFTTTHTQAYFMSHLTSTIKHSDWMTVDSVVFDVQVDSAFHTTLLCLAWGPSLDAATQTRKCVECHKIGQFLTKPSCDHECPHNI